MTREKLKVCDEKRFENDKVVHSKYYCFVIKHFSYFIVEIA